MSSSETYIPGDVARIWLTAADIAGDATDPSVLTIEVKPPRADIVVPPAINIIRDSAGLYHFDLQLDKAGTWYWRWTTGAPATGAAEGQITVQPSRFIP